MFFRGIKFKPFFSVHKEYNKKCIHTHNVYKFLFLKVKIRNIYPAVLFTPPPELAITYFIEFISNIYVNVNGLKAAN